MPFLILILLVVAEIFVLITVGGWIGAGWTLLLLVAFSALGLFLLRREGSKAFRALRDTLDTRQPPHREIADGMLIFLGGMLMVLPGFISDVLGLMCLLPPTRALVRRGLFGVALRRVPAPLRFRTSRDPAGRAQTGPAKTDPAAAGRQAPHGQPDGGDRTGRRPVPPVIEGEIDPR